MISILFMQLHSQVQTSKSELQKSTVMLQNKIIELQQRNLELQKSNADREHTIKNITDLYHVKNEQVKCYIYDSKINISYIMYQDQ